MDSAEQGAERGGSMQAATPVGKPWEDAARVGQGSAKRKSRPDPSDEEDVQFEHKQARTEESQAAASSSNDDGAPHSEQLEVPFDEAAAHIEQPEVPMDADNGSSNDSADDESVDSVDLRSDWIETIFSSDDEDSTDYNSLSEDSDGPSTSSAQSPPAAAAAAPAAGASCQAAPAPAPPAPASSGCQAAPAPAPPAPARASAAAARRRPSSAAAQVQAQDVEPPAPNAEDDESDAVSVGGMAVEKISLKKKGKKTRGRESGCLLQALFGRNKVIVNEVPIEKGKDQHLEVPKPTYALQGKTLEFVVAKVCDDGSQMWDQLRIKREMVRMWYVQTSSDAAGVATLQSRLEAYADFSALQLPNKVAARLELLVSEGHLVNTFFSNEMEVLPLEAEPQPSKESGGCGFIPEHMVSRLRAGSRGRVPRGSTSFQVRILAPKLGLFKGMLTVKPGIDRIQLPQSMLKVPPSRSAKPEDCRAWIVVRLAHPTDSNRILGKWLKGVSPSQSFIRQKTSKKFSPMLQRLLEAVRVPEKVLKEYQEPQAEQNFLRKEAWVVGVADPTSKLPDGHLFISGLPESEVLDVDGKKQIFITRSPCLHSSDGQRLPLLTSRPASMSEEEWSALMSRPFGEVLFPCRGRALPEAIASGDIDGDLYWICWDKHMVSRVEPGPLPREADLADQDANPLPRLGAQWLERARSHMLDPSIHRGRFLIGKLYKAAVKKREEKGMDHEDVLALWNAYKECIDRGKHGGDLHLPDHLWLELNIPRPNS
mmetsp:Transcript_75529/g.179418  ORF Transcript_75529/g.179418 Transcript_75529/m.179418 type:complete len:766 (-) Transcript_75529:25-2322(-)